MASAYLAFVGRNAFAMSAYLKRGSESLFSLPAKRRACVREMFSPTALKAFCTCTAVAYPLPSVSKSPQNCNRLKSDFSANFSLKHSNLLSVSICEFSTPATSHSLATKRMLLFALAAPYSNRLSSLSVELQLLVQQLLSVSLHEQPLRGCTTCRRDKLLLELMLRSALHFGRLASLLRLKAAECEEPPVDEVSREQEQS